MGIRDERGTIWPLSITPKKTCGLQLYWDVQAPEGTSNHVIRHAVTGMSACATTASQPVQAIRPDRRPAAAEVFPYHVGPQPEPHCHARLIVAEAEPEGTRRERM